MRVICFDVYVRDYKRKKTEFLGSVPERRGKSRHGKEVDLRGGRIYARIVFSGIVADPLSIFVIARTVNNGKKGDIKYVEIC